MPHSWDPDTYAIFADERSRPFLDLTARISATGPRRVADLGAGTGELTALLAQRWPDADVTAVDASPAMIERAAHVDGIAVELADLADWEPPAPLDVLVANASLQWVPGHLELLPRLLSLVAPGGWFALQVPGNFDEPSHAIRRELAADPRFAPYTDRVASPSAHGAATYLDALSRLGCEVDAWETTYLHVLHGRDPVLDWVRGTGARPTLQALPPELRAAFEAELGDRLREAYPDRGRGVVMPFRRVFAVARRLEEDDATGAA